MFSNEKEPTFCEVFYKIFKIWEWVENKLKVFCTDAPAERNSKFLSQIFMPKIHEKTLFTYIRIEHESFEL